MQLAALVSKTKGFKAGDRLFSWRKVGLMSSGDASLVDASKALQDGTECLQDAR